jgi:hypothetical protein
MHPACSPSAHLLYGVCSVERSCSVSRISPVKRPRCHSGHTRCISTGNGGASWPDNRARQASRFASPGSSRLASAGCAAHSAFRIVRSASTVLDLACQPKLNGKTHARGDQPSPGTPSHSAWCGLHNRKGGRDGSGQLAPMRTPRMRPTVGSRRLSPSRAPGPCTAKASAFAMHWHPGLPAAPNI